MSTINNSDLLLVERDGNLYQIAYDQMSTLNDNDIFCVERDGVSYKVEAQYVNFLSGTIHTPVEVLTPLDGAGVGGDRTFTPMSSEINHGGTSYSGRHGGTIQMYGLVYGTTSNGSKYYVVGRQLGADFANMIFNTRQYGLLTATNPDVSNPWSLNDLGSMVTTSDWGSVASGGGKVVALSRSYNDPQKIAVSTDGTTFSEKSVSLNNHTWTSITYGGGRFVAVAEYGNDPGNYKLAAYSTDGENWTLTNQTLTRSFWQSVTYGDGKFVAVANGNYDDSDNGSIVQLEPKIMYSTDGNTWTDVNIPAADSISFNSVTYGDGKFVAVGSPAYFGGHNQGNETWGTKHIAYSYDAINWNYVSIPNPLSHYLKDVAYGNGRFVAVGSTSGIGNNPDTTYFIITSTDCINWTGVETNSTLPNGSTFDGMNRITFGDMFVAIADDQKSLYYSTDGLEWKDGIRSLVLSNENISDLDDTTFTSTDTTLSTVFSGGDQVRSDVTAAKTGFLESDPVSSKIRLRDINNTANNDNWQVGERVVKLGQITEYAPGPREMIFTSQNASTTPFSSTDATLLSRTWTLETRSTESDPWSVVASYDDFDVSASQDGSTAWTTTKPTLQPNTMYRVKVKYNSTNAQSEESTYHTFTTGSIQ